MKVAATELTEYPEQAIPVATSEKEKPEGGKPK